MSWTGWVLYVSDDGASLRLDSCSADQTTVAWLDCVIGGDMAISPLLCLSQLLDSELRVACGTVSWLGR